MATDTVFEGSVGFNGDLEKDFESARLVKVWESAAVAFGDLGSGASDSIVIADSDLPTKIIFQGASAKTGATDFAGEADLAFTVGHEGGDTDAYIASTNLDATGDADEIVVVPGAVKGGAYVDDTSTIAILFTATELDDVTAGSLTVKIYYMDV